MPLIQSALLLAILGSGDGHSRPGPGDLDLYRAAALRAGRDADAHVRLALWCEARHLVKEHDAELAEALRRRDPREFIGPVIDYLRKPPKLTIKAIGDPGDPGRIEVEGIEPRLHVIPTEEEFRGSAGSDPKAPAKRLGH